MRTSLATLVKGRLRWAIVSIAVLLALSLSVLGRETRDGQRWVTVDRARLRLEVPVSGEVRAQRIATYASPSSAFIWNFRIAQMASEGSTVEAGEIVLSFDTSELEQRLRRVEAERDSAYGRYQQRKKDFEVRLREQQLALSEAQTQVRRAEVTAGLPEDLVARSELEKAEIDLELSRKEVAYRETHQQYLERRADLEAEGLLERRNRAAAEVAAIERAIDLMTVRAQRPGIVMHRANRRGEKKKVGDTAWRGEVLLEIPELAEMRVDAWVEEAESGKLEVGQTAKLRLDAHPDIALVARVDAIQQTVEQRSRRDPRKVVRLDLSLLRPDPRFVRPGMRVQGSILVEERENVLVVPVEALERGASEPAVVVKTFLGTAQRKVELGLRSAERVEVRGGLEAGDRVLVSG
ncbi:MAG TPA: HlyD family efflux transporter periplasmic adaptor subunit [Thermoanaerobaculia bacterium]|nr:HlyD family efflux transporter periplasmic adaptor subunit [Thermoanaerobaculia bacterium]